MSGKYDGKRWRTPQDEVKANVAKLTEDVKIDIEGLKKVSPVKIPSEGSEQAALFLKTLFNDDELVAYNRFEGFCDDGSAPPFKAPDVMRRSQLVAILQDPKWFADPKPITRRICVNPLRAKKCSGKYGTLTDCDVTAFRHLLVECDDLDLDTQVKLLSVLPLPIVAMTLSGGRSIHAIIQHSAATIEEFKSASRDLYRLLEPLGFDPSCSNPGRYARLAGSPRPYKDGRRVPQELIYLNATPTTTPIFQHEIKR